MFKGHQLLHDTLRQTPIPLASHTLADYDDLESIGQGTDSHT